MSIVKSSIANLNLSMIITIISHRDFKIDFIIGRFIQQYIKNIKNITQLIY